MSRRVKSARHQRTNVVSFPLHEVPRVVGFIRTERRALGAAWREGDAESGLHGYRTLLWQDEKVLETDGTEGCTIA